MFKRMFPELHVTDCEAAARFFEGALGFRRGYVLVEDGVLDFAVLEHPESSLQLLLHHMMPDAASAEPRYVRLYFEPTDIRGLCATLKARGYAVSDPEPTDYGSIEAHLAGPDGYMIWFQQWSTAD